MVRGNFTQHIEWWSTTNAPTHVKSWHSQPDPEKNKFSKIITRRWGNMKNVKKAIWCCQEKLAEMFHEMVQWPEVGSTAHCQERITGLCCSQARRQVHTLWRSHASVSRPEGLCNVLCKHYKASWHSHVNKNQVLWSQHWCFSNIRKFLCGKDYDWDGYAILSYWLHKHTGIYLYFWRNVTSLSNIMVWQSSFGFPCAK